MRNMFLIALALLLSTTLRAQTVLPYDACPIADHWICTNWDDCRSQKTTTMIAYNAETGQTKNIPAPAGYHFTGGNIALQDPADPNGFYLLIAKDSSIVLMEALTGTMTYLGKGTNVGINGKMTSNMYSLGIDNVGIGILYLPSSKANKVSVPIVQKTSAALNQNFPNPFNPETTISYSIPSAGKVTLKLYDIQGREISTLVDEEQAAGEHIVHLNASHYASGTYFYSLQSGDYISARKMILLK